MRVFVHQSVFFHELSDWFQLLLEEVSSRRGVVFPGPWLHAEVSEWRQRDVKVVDNHGGLACMDTSVV